VPEPRIACTLNYIVRGVATDRRGKADLLAELVELLPGASNVTVLPVNEGFTVAIEMTDIAPFNRTSFEPYVADHILREAVALRCTSVGSVHLDLLKAQFS
tara:strand:- start:3497 stop:3799 length:303 start_codon:yes stop_codon:yes gene_type:complete